MISLTELENSLFETVYKKYYTGEHGECRYYGICKKCLKNKQPKHQCDRVRIGENYGKNKLPKILFVGIEGFCDYVNEYNVVNAFSRPSSTANNAHYNGLLYIMQYLLSSYGKCPKPKKVEINNHDQFNLTDKFALTNLYRCAFVSKDSLNETRGLSHTAGMKEHCPEILLDEINCLCPDIIVIQTSQWPKGLFDKMKDNYEFNEPELSFGKYNETSLYKGHIGNKPIFLLCTYHGAYAKYSSKQYLSEQLNPVLDKAIELMNSKA